jgi:hypothetical protein
LEYDGDEWGEGNEDYDRLEDLLYESVVQGDYSEVGFEQELDSLGPPGEWESGVIIIDGEGDYILHVVDSDGEPHQFTVGNVSDERGIDDLYEWCKENDVPDFDVLYEGD